MKQSILLLAILMSSCLAFSQQNPYEVLPDSLEIHKTFIMSGGENSFADHYLLKKRIKGEKEYVVRARNYSWGGVDTALFRQEDGNIYAYDAETGKETIDVPTEPSVGQSWLESDGSWRYEIISISANLETPVKEYQDLLVIQAKQLTGRDKDKATKYLNYYAKGVGYIASVVDGKLMSYLKEMTFK